MTYSQPDNTPDEKANQEPTGSYRSPVETPSARQHRALPDPRERPVLLAPEVFKLLGIHSSTGYQAIQDGSFPLPVIRVGRTIRVPTRAVHQLLAGQEVSSED